MKAGTHVKVWRGCYYHHGIYVGTGQVVHYKSHGIVMTSLDDFTQSMKCYTEIAVDKHPKIW